MEGEGFLYLCSFHRLMGIDINKLLNGKFQTVPPPDFTRLPVDKLIVFQEENLPATMGFCVDGSKLYMVGGQWTEKYPGHWESRDFLKGDESISPNMYVADLSDPVVKFYWVHEFEAAKSCPVVVKIEKGIYALSSSFAFFGGRKLCPSPGFELYDPSSETITRLQTPPFQECFQPPAKRKRPPPRKVTGHALVGNTLCVEVSHCYHFYDFNSGIWRPNPDPGDKSFPLLSFIFENGLGQKLCHGKFVLGWEDVLVTVYRNSMGALLFPPLGSDSDENALAFSQTFNEVDNDLRKIQKYHGEIGNGLILNLDTQKMCAIFVSDWNPDKFLVYIYIFQVSKLPEQPRAKALPMDFRVKPKDFMSVTCLHKGFYELDERGCDFPFLTGAFSLRDGNAVSYQGII